MLFVGIVSGLAIIIYAIRKYKESKWGVCLSSRSMEGKNVIITGANSGIGKETARDLAGRGAVVILACRNKEAAQNAVKDIRTTTANGDLIIVELDLSNFASIRRSASNILEKFPHIDILINNAGVYAPADMNMKTDDGFEAHFGVNHLGHFLFTNLLLDRIKETPQSRIIIVSSLLYKYGEINFETISDVEKAKVAIKNRKGRNPLYSDSKLCNILHGLELKNKFAGSSTSVFVLCPGFVYTGLMRHSMESYNCCQKLCFLPVIFFFMRNSKQGAQTSIHCAVSEELKDIPFGFYRDCKEAEISENDLAKDKELASALWEYSADIVKKCEEN